MGDRARKGIRVRALLDSGSDRSYIVRGVIDQAGIMIIGSEWINVTMLFSESGRNMELVNIKVRGITATRCLKLNNVLVVDRMPPRLSGSAASVSQVLDHPHLRDIPYPRVSCKPIELLIGQDCPGALAPIDFRVGSEGGPFAIKTQLGWVVSGPMEENSEHRPGFMLSSLTNTNGICFNGGLEAMIGRLWEVENAYETRGSTRLMSARDQEVIHLWDEQGRLVNGHYQLPIPFKSEVPWMDDNLTFARQRLWSLKRRLLKNENLHRRYTIEMEKLMKRGYAERAPWDGRFSRPGLDRYVSHHPVFQLSKPEKTRVVFDCAAQVQGRSLNQMVAQGPDLTNGLEGVLIRFRKEPVALMADIEAMFHQVSVPERDRNALCFLWWPGGNLRLEPATFRMTVHLFGGVWSPSCASYALRRTFREFGNLFPDVQDCIEGFYVDDLLISLPSAVEAIKTANQLRELVSKGGFHLTKWISNDRAVLGSITPEDRGAGARQIELGGDRLPMERALGVTWDLQEDSFGVKLTNNNRPITKRGLLSTVSSVYDPLGVLCPVIVVAKLMFQEECRRKLGWDEPLTEKRAAEWKGWLRGLDNLKGVRVPCCYFSGGIKGMFRLQLHHFCDASQVAYASVTYLTGVNSDGLNCCAFVQGRSRLAPLKPMTIPRLELCAAVMAVEGEERVKGELKVPLLESVFWTDSMIVLGYIGNRDKRYHTFVANRLSFIWEKTSTRQWRHVRSGENPADEATRGRTAEEIITGSTWIRGPEFLKGAPEEWPKGPITLKVDERDPEVKRETVTFMSVSQSEHNPLLPLWRRYGSWYELKRGVSWIRLVFERLQKGRRGESWSPRRAELAAAERVILMLVQREAYGEEIESIELKKLQRNSHLYRLEPYMSEDLVRVGGRMGRAQPDAKEPILLPAKHPVTKLIISEVHSELAGHSGREHTLANLRDRFWIPRPRAVIDQIIKNCIVCRRNNFRPLRQREADLPKDRVEPGGRPFRSTGLDVFGPIWVKQGRKRIKRFGCLFTCMTTRAVHLEVLEALDTDALLNTISRFVSRRGTPEKIRSDNGTNMVAASKEISETVKKLSTNERMVKSLQRKGVEWSFIPPGAPYMGGAWERQIGTAKKVLRAIIGDQSIDDYRLMTLFVKWNW